MHWERVVGDNKMWSCMWCAPCFRLFLATCVCRELLLFLLVRHCLCILWRLRSFWLLCKDLSKSWDNLMQEQDFIFITYHLLCHFHRIRPWFLSRQLLYLTLKKQKLAHAPYHSFTILHLLRWQSCTSDMERQQDSSIPAREHPEELPCGHGKGRH